MPNYGATSSLTNWHACLAVLHYKRIQFNREVSGASVQISHHSHCDVCLSQWVTITNEGLTTNNTAPTGEIHKC